MYVAYSYTGNSVFDTIANRISESFPTKKEALAWLEMVRKEDGLTYDVAHYESCIFCNVE